AHRVAAALMRVQKIAVLVVGLLSRRCTYSLGRVIVAGVRNCWMNAKKSRTWVVVGANCSTNGSTGPIGLGSTAAMGGTDVFQMPSITLVTGGTVESPVVGPVVPESAGSATAGAAAKAIPQAAAAMARSNGAALRADVLISVLLSWSARAGVPSGIFCWNTY